MNKTLAITTIVLVAVVMGMSAVAPAIPQAEARPGPNLPSAACDALVQIQNPSEAIQHILLDPCLEI